MDCEFSNGQQSNDCKEDEVRWRLNPEQIGKEVGDLRENGDNEQTADQKKPEERIRGVELSFTQFSDDENEHE